MFEDSLLTFFVPFQAMEIHIDYIIYFINFVIYVILCYMIIKQAKNDIFAPNQKERKSEVRCPTHGRLLSIPYGYKQHITRS